MKIFNPKIFIWYNYFMYSYTWWRFKNTRYGGWIKDIYPKLEKYSKNLRKLGKITHFEYFVVMKYEK